jgi:hypothetical protein
MKWQICPVFNKNKMELIKKLQKQENSKSNNDYRMLDAVKAGEYKMSVQGSTIHYCSPRTTLPVEDYALMELALFNKKGWLHITRSSVLKAFPRYNELLKRTIVVRTICLHHLSQASVNSSSPVFGYVPVDLLNDLYVYLNGA